MASAAYEIAWVSERHLRVSVGADTSAATNGRVRGACAALRGAGLPGLIDVTPAYATVLVTFDVGAVEAGSAEQRVRGALEQARDAGEAAPGRSVEIPVCYEGGFAPDIGDVARLHGTSMREVAAMHSGGAYLVQFLGFSPGFAYLGGLPAGLATPRLERPRTRVPAGSVGIAGEQTGIYPHATPGGWRLIGRTPLRMFDAERDPPALLAMGDRVRFVPIDSARFAALAAEEH